MNLFEVFAEQLQQLTTAKRFLIAYSGGLDSQVLLHLMHQLHSKNPSLQLRAVHINHGLSQSAAAWVGHCQQQAQHYHIPIIVQQLQLKKNNGESLEAQARRQRYAAFAEMLQPDEILLTAHHQDDQAETLLLQLMRGAGVRGLSAMPAKKIFAKSYHARPLLQFSRDAIETYANLHQLKWVDDESNLDTNFDRNYLRQQVMPLLKTRWPSVTSTLRRTALHCASASDCLDDLAVMDLAAARTAQPSVIDVNPLKELSKTRMTNALRYWLHQLKILPPATKKLQHIIDDVIYANPDAIPCVSWDQIELRRYRDKIFCLSPLLPHDSSLVLSWDFQAPLTLPSGLGSLHANQSAHCGIRADVDVTKISVRFRQGGEKICPAGRHETHALKKLLQEWGVPPWERERIPLIYFEEHLIAVVGFCVASDFYTETNAIVIKQVQNHSL